VSESEPVLRVVKGTPTPEELAALVAVVAARARAAAPPEESSLRLSRWVASGLERGARTRANW
jgi:hypothetical protein